MSTRIIFLEKITSFAGLLGSGLNEVLQLKAQSCIFTKSLFSLDAETLALFTTEEKEISSANSLTIVARPRGRSLIKMRKNNGLELNPVANQL